jgi:nucleotide-binding universal stress UspA family protein
MKDLLPLKKILWPTDFSEPADRALHVAARLCSIFSAELMVIHVVSPIMLAPPGPGVGTGEFRYPRLMEDMLAMAENSLQEWRENRVPKEIKSQYRAILGNPGDQIVHTAQNESTDVIVIATHGLTGWRRFIFGSVAEKVVRLATCPVLTIPATPEGEQE